MSPTPTASPMTIALPGEIDDEFFRIVDELTRRGFLVGGLTAAALGLAGCADDGTDPASSATAGRRSVATIHGTVQVPADPKRVVATDFPEACALIDLGIALAGRPQYIPAFPAYTKAVQHVPVITDSSSLPDLEKIATARPDLIIGDDWADPAKQRIPFAKLSALAPTTLFAWQQSAGNWTELAAQTALAVGRTKQLDALATAYRNKAKAIKTTFANLLSGLTWDLVDVVASGEWDLYGASASHSAVAREAGIRLGAGATLKTGFEQLSTERLELLEHTDVIITDPNSLKTLRQNALFQSLPAVKAGRVFTTSLFFPASYGVATALLDDLDKFCRTLLKEKH